jgi:hypothetical protein
MRETIPDSVRVDRIGESGVIERDPQGWWVEPVSDQQVRYIEIMKTRGEWDSVAADKAMEGLRRQLKPGEPSLVVVGREASSPSSFIDLTTALAEDIEDTPDDEARPARLAILPEIPSPLELNNFLRNVSNGQGHEWSATGQVPYLILHRTLPGVVEFGTMNSRSSRRTNTVRSYDDGIV